LALRGSCITVQRPVQPTLNDLTYYKSLQDLMRLPLKRTDRARRRLLELEASAVKSAAAHPCSCAVSVAVELGSWRGRCAPAGNSMGWSQSRLARASGVSRTVVNEVENGRRNPSLPTYDKLRRALGLDLASSLALLPTATPASLSERFLTTVAAILITAGRLELADAAAALQADATAVRTAVAQLADRLAAVGVAAVDDGVTIELTVLAHASQAVERIRPLEAVPTLTTEATMTLVIVGHLGEATRRDVDERRAADSTSVRTSSPPAAY